MKIVQELCPGEKNGGPGRLVTRWKPSVSPGAGSSGPGRTPAAGGLGGAARPPPTSRARRPAPTANRRQAGRVSSPGEGLGSQSPGVSATSVFLVENGHKAPTVLVARQLADALGVTTAALMAEWDRRSRAADR